MRVITDVYVYSLKCRCLYLDACARLMSINVSMVCLTALCVGVCLSVCLFVGLSVHAKYWYVTYAHVSVGSCVSEGQCVQYRVLWRECNTS